MTRMASHLRRGDDAGFLGSLRHPHVAGVTEDLADRHLDRPEAICAVGLAVCSALDAAHRWGISHGAVTLAAIGFDATGRPKLGGFGLAPACPLATDVDDLCAVLVDLLRGHPVPTPIASALRARWPDGFELGVGLASAAAQAWAPRWLADSGIPVLATNIERWAISE